jgi:ATP-dependent helicase/nuclease subunit A
MSKWTPADQAVRVAVEHDGERTFMIEAGAGTGKTELMVYRAVAMIRAGHASVDDLVIITFTDDAAAEIAARTRQTLQLLATGTDEQVTAKRLTPLAGDEVQRVRDALAGIHRARIQTIHSFCGALLRERPVEAGLDPAFVTLDEMQASADFDRAFREWFDRVLENPPAGLVMAMERGLGASKVRALAEVFQAHRAVLPMHMPAVPMTPIDDFVAVLLDNAAELRTLVDDCDPGDAGVTDIGNIISLADQVSLLWDVGDEAGVMRVLLTQAPELKHGTGVLASWGDEDDGRRATELRKEVHTALSAAQAELGTAVLMGLLPAVQDFVLGYAEQRRRDGVATFDDLLLWSRDLLRRAPAREYFRSHIRRIIVDEFQDTDPVQADIVFCLAGEGAPPGGTDWTVMDPRPGVLTLVGDPKQSIYRFRRADLAVFDGIRTGVMSAHQQQITQNFRSREGVLAWVNEVFSEQFVAEPGVQPANVPLEHSPRPEEFDHPAVHVAWAGPHEKLGPARKDEGELLARMLINARAREWKVFDKGTGTVRDITWGDMVVLVPAWTDFEEFRDALTRMGVPFRVGGGKGFFGRTEVGDLCHLLEAIDDPLNDIAVAAALRSPIFGCSDDDLLLAVGTGRGISYRQYATKDCPPRVADALRMVRDMHDVLPRLTLVEAVTMAVDRSLLVEQALARGDDEQAAANLLKVVDLARRFGDAGPLGDTAGLRDFSRWMREQREVEDDPLRSSLREGDAGIADAGDNVVRVMTVHASKGLEFPLVALANMCGRRNIERAPFPDRSGSTVHVRIKGTGGTHFESPGFKAAWPHEQKAQKAELTRLMYVAATRARDHLLIPLALDTSKFGPLATHFRNHIPDYVTAMAGGADDDMVNVVPADELAAVEPLPGADPGEADDAAVSAAQADREAWLEDRGQLLQAASAELQVTAATAHGADREPGGGEDLPVSGEDDLPADAGADDTSAADEAPGPALTATAADDGDTEATRKGRALHLVMEIIDYEAPGDLDAAVAHACAEENATGHEAEVRAWVGACLASDAVRRAIAADEIHREVPFTIVVDEGKAYEVGRIDLLIREGDDLTVVDWKSDRVKAGDEQAHTEKWHRHQADAYVRALRASLPEQFHVNEVVFVYARTGGEGAIRPEQLF